MKENKGIDFLRSNNPNIHKTMGGPARREEKMAKRWIGEDEKIEKPKDVIGVFLSRYAEVLQRKGERERKKGIEAIWRMVKRDNIIKEENISRAFGSHINRKRDRGEDIAESEIPRLKKEYAERVIGDQEDSLYNWIEYFASHETDAYPLWFKFLALKNVLRVGEYKVNEKQFYKRTKYTAKPFLTLNKQALAGIYEHFNKIVEGKDIETEDEEFRTYLENKNFVKAYIRRMEILKRNRGAEHLEVIDGKWRRFTKKQQQEMFDSLQGHHTGWCLEDSNEQRHRYLRDGDALIYYSNDKRGDPTVPRLTIAFDGERIKEISGIEKGQTLDEYIFPVLKEKLEEYPQEAERYNKVAEDMKRITEIHNSPLSISKEDLRFLYEIDGKIHNFRGNPDPRVKEILRGRDKREDVAYIFGVTKDQISTSREEALSGKCTHHLGDLTIGDLAKLKRNGGTKFPIIVGGRYAIYLSITNIKDIPPLPEGVNILHLNSLTSPEGLNIPEGVRSLSLDGLKTAEGLNIPEGVRSLSLDGLKTAEGLKIPEGVGVLDLNGLTTAEGLKIPEGVKHLYLNGLTTAEGLKIPEGVKHLHLNSLTNPEGLNMPERVVWLELKGLPSAEEFPPPPNDLERLFVSQHMSDEEFNKLKEQYPHIEIK
ncbi:MAG: hypothetical protein OXU73_02995 [Candidatus Campbellbacteria bacterium]|nr:hypothetical protein [Candidatus Campbellbacteria bacterium]